MYRIATFTTAILFSALQLHAAETRSFSFIHMSDVHVTPYQTMPSESELARGRSYNVVQTVKNLDRVRLDPYGIMAPKPSFMVVTGDVTEFGYPGATWDVAQKYFGDLGIPVCTLAGNHDNTWVAAPNKMKKIGCGLNYSFDHEGIHFAVLNTATLQAPNPSVGEEVLQFIRKDFSKLPEGTPIIVAFHHPLEGKEFASAYDTDRLIDALHDYNVILMLYGHGHGATHDNWGHIDAIQGGSPFSNNAEAKTQGYGIVTVQNNQISAAYKTVHEAGARKALIQKTFSNKVTFPKINFESPQAFEALAKPELKLRATIAAGLYSAAWYDLDDETSDMLQLKGGLTAEGAVKLDGLKNGAHFLRVNFRDRNGNTASRSTCFYLDVPGNGGPVAKWRFKMNGGSKATPLVHNGVVYVGASDGVFYAIDANTGKPLWHVDAEDEILGTAAVFNDNILFGTGGGRFCAIGPDGKLRWCYDAGAAVFSSPVVDDEGVVYFGTNGGDLVALNSSNGQLVWKNEDPQMSIESQPFVKGEFVYCGAWDGYLYAIDRKSGKTAWKTPGSKAQNSAKTYYAPGDNGPVATAENVFIADRGYEAGKYDLQGKFLAKFSTAASALALSQDCNAIYVRGSQPFSKVDLNGTQLWAAPDVKPGNIPVSPIEVDGVVYVCTGTGTLNALKADTGEKLWEYQVSPKLYVMSGQAVKDGVVYSTGLDGMVTAVGK